MVWQYDIKQCNKTYSVTEEECWHFAVGVEGVNGKYRRGKWGTYKRSQGLVGFS